MARQVLQAVITSDVEVGLYLTVLQNGIQSLGQAVVRLDQPLVEIIYLQPHFLVAYTILLMAVIDI